MSLDVTDSNPRDSSNYAGIDEIAVGMDERVDQDKDTTDNHKDSKHGQEGASGNDSEKNETKDVKWYSIPGLYSSLLKQTDQMSPLRLAKMPRWSALLVMFLIFSAWIIGFFYQIADQYGYCSKASGCVTCSITLEEVENAKCTNLATTDLQISAGCLSVPLLNKFDVVQSAFSEIDIMVASEQVSDIPDTFLASYQKHKEILGAIRSNDLNQMVDPDPEKVRAFMVDNFMGLNGRFAQRPDVNALSDDVLITSGLKLIYSYLTIGCVIASHDKSKTRQQTILGTDFLLMTVKSDELVCAGAVSALTAALDRSLTDASHGIEGVELAIPINYVMSMDSLPPAAFIQATSEMVFYDPVTSSVAHCPANVYTRTPAKLNGRLYQCCVERDNLEKLANANAFSGLAMTFAILATTVIFWPWNPRGKKESLLSIMREEVTSMLE